MKDIMIIEVKSEIGAGTRGASLGVEAVKIASLDLGSDLFNRIDSIEVEHVNELLFNSADHAYAKFIDGVLIMEERVCLEVYEQLFEDRFPLIISGDHSTAYGTIAGITKAMPKKRLGVIWIDAHADLHTPHTTPSGNLHGMTLSMACGFDNLECKVNNPKGETLDYWEQSQQVGKPGEKVLPEDIVFIGVRDLEKPENYLVNKYGMGYIEVEDIRKRGAEEAARKALKMLEHCDMIYVSFDVDSIDSRFSSGTGTPVPNGLTPEEVRVLNATLALDPKVCAWEVAEINPTLDTENRMAETAFEVIQAVTASVQSRA